MPKGRGSQESELSNRFESCGHGVPESLQPFESKKTKGKISRDEWNAVVSQAQEVLNLAEQGKLTDEERRKQFAAF